VSSDRENWEFAGQLNDPGIKNGKPPGISQKEGKSGNFHSIISFLKKKNCQVCFYFFFRRKIEPFFIFNFQQLTKYIS